MVLMRKASVMVAALGAMTLAGCAHHDRGPQAYNSGGGLHLMGGHSTGPVVQGIGVNAYLWRATLHAIVHAAGLR